MRLCALSTAREECRAGAAERTGWVQCSEAGVADAQRCPAFRQDLSLRQDGGRAREQLRATGVVEVLEALREARLGPLLSEAANASLQLLMGAE